MYSRDARYYDTITAERMDGDLPLYERAAHRDVKNILEIGCGTGRILLSLYEPGRHLTGSDLSADMLKIAEEKSARYDIPAEWVQADMCSLPDLGQFDLIICGFNSLQHICDFGQALDCLKGVKRSLAPNGLFLLDLYLPNPFYLSIHGDTHPLLSFQEESGAEIRITEDDLYDPKTLLNDVTYHYYRDGEFLFSEEYLIKEYPPQILEDLIRQSGLSISASYGNYDFSPLRCGSPKQIYFLKHAC